MPQVTDLCDLSNRHANIIYVLRQTTCKLSEIEMYDVNYIY